MVEKFLGSLVPQIKRQSFCIKMVNGLSHIMIPVIIKTCGNCAPKFSNAQKLFLHSLLLSIIL